MNPNVKLSLDGRQPQKQKNGFKIYRIVAQSPTQIRIYHLNFKSNHSLIPFGEKLNIKSSIKTIVTY